MPGSIEVVAGDPLRTIITHLDEYNEPILGETWTVQVAEKADGSPFVPTITERGNGFYNVAGTTLATDPPGEWLLVVTAGSNNAHYQQVWDVTQGRPPIVIVQPPTTRGVSRRDLRRMIAQQLGDYHFVTATAQGTSSMIVSERDLSQEYNYFAGMQVYVVGGTAANIGLTSTVRVSDDTNRSISLVPSLNADTMPGDTFEMYNLRSTGWKVEQYNNAINDAIVRAGEEHATEPVVYEVPGYFNRQSPYIAIPEEFTHFSGVQFTDARGNRKSVLPTGYSVDFATYELTITGDWAGKAHGKSIRLIGHRRPGTLETDDARTSIGAEWVVADAKAILLGHDTARGTTQGARDRMFYLERQGSEGRRPSILTSYPPNTVQLR